MESLRRAPDPTNARPPPAALSTLSLGVRSAAFLGRPTQRQNAMLARASPRTLPPTLALAVTPGVAAVDCASGERRRGETKAAARALRGAPDGGTDEPGWP